MYQTLDDLENIQDSQENPSKWGIYLRIVSTILTTVFLFWLALMLVTHRNSWKMIINTYSPVVCIMSFIICFIFIRPKKRIKWIIIGLWLIILYWYLYRFIDMIYYTDYERILSAWGIFMISISAILIRKMVKKHDIIRLWNTWRWIIIILLFLSLWGLWLWLSKQFKLLDWSVCVEMSSYNYKCCNLGYCYHYSDYPAGMFKPIIYLYPTTKTEINVKLWTPKNLSHTYPKYNLEKWRNIIAQPNGDLEDMDTWRKLYALYREWKSDIKLNFDEWFVVEWKDITSFLEEKLSTLWLNEREAEEFIVYWLPQMEDNKYNLIRFETIEEQNENMPLNITPKPDTIIRVMMDWKAIDEPIEIPEQQFTTPERNWFTVVERWGSPRY